MLRARHTPVTLNCCPCWRLALTLRGTITALDHRPDRPRRSRPSRPIAVRLVTMTSAGGRAASRPLVRHNAPQFPSPPGCACPRRSSLLPSRLRRRLTLPTRTGSAPHRTGCGRICFVLCWFAGRRSRRLAARPAVDPGVPRTPDGPRVAPSRLVLGLRVGAAAAVGLAVPLTHRQWADKRRTGLRAERGRGLSLGAIQAICLSAAGLAFLDWTRVRVVPADRHGCLCLRPALLLVAATQRWRVSLMGHVSG